METHCIICGKEAEQGGYTSRIKEHVLRPLCSRCDELCSSQPDVILKDYPWLFGPSSTAPSMAPDMWKCVKCGKPNRSDRTFCWSCSTVKGASAPPAKTSAIQEDTSEEAHQNRNERERFVSASFGTGNNPAINRYLDLYRAARLLTALGTTIKTVGIILAAIIFSFWFIVGIAAVSQSQPSSPFGPSTATQSAAQTVTFFICIIIGAVFGVTVGGLFFLLGVLISAQGQLLLAHADSAVHTSPFLNNEERAAAMSLPFSAPSNTSLDRSGG